MIYIAEKAKSVWGAFGFIKVYVCGEALSVSLPGEKDFTRVAWNFPKPEMVWGIRLRMTIIFSLRRVQNVEVC